MEIWVYDRNLYLQGVIENQTSMLWTRRYFEPGDFEIHAPITEENIRILAKGNIVAKHEDGTEAGVIEDIIREETDQKSEIPASGRFASSYFDRRLIKATININDTPENAMRTLINYCEAIPLVELGDAAGIAGNKIQFQATYKNLLTYLEKIAQSGQIGFRLLPDFANRKLIFQAYQGTDRSLSQSENSRVVFSETYNNLSQINYHWNDQLKKTKIYIGGEGEGSARKYVSIGGGEGLDLRELFVDAKDISSEGLTTAQYEEALKQRGYEKMRECLESETIQYETGADINFKYKVNYDLGDIVTIRKKGWDFQLDQRITEIQEVYEHSVMHILPTLGDPLPETIDWEDDQ